MALIDEDHIEVLDGDPHAVSDGRGPLEHLPRGIELRPFLKLRVDLVFISLRVF